MSYPVLTSEQISFFDKHGWLVVEDAIPGDVLDQLEHHCEKILTDKERLAYDWAWNKDEDSENRSFRIVQSWPSLVWKEIADQPYRKWLTAAASQLMGMPIAFWYDQFLAKPPGKSVPTEWHQDEGYWGRNLDDKGITCWMPLHDVSPENGCMHFIDEGHREGILTHRRVEGMASDLLTCSVDEDRTIACPIKRGSVTFHHSKMPHMTTANVSQRWRKAVTNHMYAEGVTGEGDHYPWRVHVHQPLDLKSLGQSEK